MINPQNQKLQIERRTKKIASLAIRGSKREDRGVLKKGKVY